jgi:hypothetical protein
MCVAAGDVPKASRAPSRSCTGLLGATGAPSSVVPCVCRSPPRDLIDAMIK